jgi:peptidoglycan-associated lipoprotein
MTMRRLTTVIVAMMVVAALGACGPKKPPVARPTAPPPATGGSPTGSRPAAPPEPIRESPIPPEPMITSDSLAGKDIDAINKNSPFQPVYFAYDQAEIESAGQEALNKNAGILKQYPTWVVTIEGHSDERGTAEYNLALGERRALAARNYLVSLGIPADRLRTVSYGKEFPFDPNHDESAWSKNRRAHFVVTSK